MTMRYPSLVLMIVLAGCTGNRQQPSDIAPERPWREIAASSLTANARAFVREAGAPSLAQDLGIQMQGMTDSAIERLLTRRLELPARVGIAVAYLAPASTGWYWRDAGTSFGPAVRDTAIATLSALPRVTRAVFLPTMLIGEHATVDAMREAAARLQADLVLVYRPGCQFFERYPFMGAVTYRASCTLESIVIDVRSGLFPVTMTASGEASDRRIAEDMERSGTITRLATMAAASAMAQAAARIGSALAAVPVSAGR